MGGVCSLFVCIDFSVGFYFSLLSEAKVPYNYQQNSLGFVVIVLLRHPPTTTRPDFDGLSVQFPCTLQKYPK